MIHSLGTGFGLESPDNYKIKIHIRKKNGDYNAILVGNILYSQDTARSCSHPNYELWNPASDIKESKIVEMLLGHNFSPQSKFFVVENRGKAVAVFLQRNEKIATKSLLQSAPALQALWSPVYLTPLEREGISGSYSWGSARLLLCLVVSH